MGEHEQDNYEKRFDIDTRLVSITMWIYNHAEYKDYDLGYFGTGKGAVSALKAASPDARYH